MPLGVIQRDLGTGTGHPSPGTRVGGSEKGVQGSEQAQSSPLPSSPARTGCVDLTITNLLEGAVAFVPEDITEGTPSLPSTSASKVRPEQCRSVLGWAGAATHTFPLRLRSDPRP